MTETEAKTKRKTTYERLPEMTPRKIYFILLELAGAYVKDGEFFIAQGGLREPWGYRWFPIVATDLEAARERANRMLAERNGAKFEKSPFEVV